MEYGYYRNIVMCFTLFLLFTFSGLTAQSGVFESSSVSKSQITQKQIYIANDDHTDYFWMGTDEDYRTAFISMLDYYMDQAESTAVVNPLHARGRFNCDGSLWVREYELNKSHEDFDRLVDHLRAGTITMPLNTLILLYGAMPTEAVIRNMYYAGRLERREGLRFPLITPIENQVLPAGVASIWAGSGALYAWKGICNCATRINATIRPREIYHFAGPDGQSVCMKWNSMRNYNNASIGGYAEARYPYDIVPYLDTNPGFLAVWPWHISAAFGYGWDDLDTYTDIFVDAALDLSTIERRVVVSNEVDFFEAFLESYTDSIPTFSGSFGNEWDLYTASYAEPTAEFRRNIERLRTAEALATIASLHNSTFLAGREEARDQAFVACGLYYEHDWTADGPVGREPRAQFQREMLEDMEGYVDTLLSDGIDALGSLIPEVQEEERFFVFNPLSWARTDFADLASTQSSPLHVVDVATGVEVLSQMIEVDGDTLVRILAAGVPSTGYRVYAVVPGEGESFPSSATVDLPSFDNGIYEVTLGSHGEITSCIDHKDGDRQIVEAGGAIHDLGSGGGTAVLESTGPVSTTILVEAGGNPDHESRVTLYAGIDRIDIEGRVTENFSGNTGYSSRFNLTSPQIRHEEVGMVALVDRVANGGDYADENTRTDYLTFNHFVDLSEQDRGITVSNRDSPFFKAGNSTVYYLDSSTPGITAVVGMQVDGYGLGIQNQGGDTLFVNRFAIRTHDGYNQAASMRLALEHQNPLLAGAVTGNPAVPLRPDTLTFVSLPSDDVLLWALKPAEEGIEEGVIARVWNLSENPSRFELSLPAWGISQATHTTHIETDITGLEVVDGTLSDSLATQEMKTYRLTIDPGRARK